MEVILQYVPPSQLDGTTSVLAICRSNWCVDWLLVGCRGILYLNMPGCIRGACVTEDMCYVETLEALVMVLVDVDIDG